MSGDPAREPVLEAAIRADREDPAPYGVYADWLQSRALPIGELIALDRAIDDASDPDPAQVARATEIRDTLGLPADLFVLDWRWGLWRAVHFTNLRDHMDESFDPVAAARDAFAHPACAVLEELRLGVLRWDHNHTDVPAVLAEAGRHAWAASLQHLHLGDIDSDIDMSHHVIGPVGEVISKTFPALTSLVLHSGDQSWRGEGDTFSFAGLRLPELTSLTIETCSLSSERLAAALTAELPALDTLELWFGSADYGCEVAIDELAPLLDGTRHPGVRYLGLRNAELADDLARALPASAIAARLVTLDLSMGTLSDDGARALAAGAAAFPLLVRLDVGDNFLTDAGLAALRTAFPAATVGSDAQKDDDLSIPGEVHRYVSVAE